MQTSEAVSSMTVICPNCGVRHGETPDQYASDLNGALLRASHRRVLDAVAKGRGRPVRVSEIIGHAFGHRADGGPLAARESVYSAVHAINKAIVPLGWRVENEYGRGYFLVNFAPAAGKRAKTRVWKEVREASA